MRREIIKVENISKTYTLGEIGSGSLRRDLQSLFARMRGKEDPNVKIGRKKTMKGERFDALKDISFSVNHGETIGIIGKNGAGKSTLLKILSRITSPTSGNAYINGRVSSMLEIGTGFHAELTGRENIYLNGAILGMSKSEVNAKIDDIIAFSECGQFIDTPIKRYSSGMYVKLAFAVAAHLDSEILIMDEVLAVGDMAFQKKCIEKMRGAADEGRTILYVSHNMDTVKNLCARTIVIDEGRIIFDGDTDKAIDIYLGSDKENRTSMAFEDKDMMRALKSGMKRRLKLESAHYPSNSITIAENDKLILSLKWINLEDINNLCMRFTVYDSTLKSVATAVIYDFYSGKNGDSGNITLNFDLSALAPGRYETRYTFFFREGIKQDIESFMGLSFYKQQDTLKSEIAWKNGIWGSVILPEPEIS